MSTKLKAHTAAAAVAGKNGHSLISSDKFRQLYAALVKYELLHERMGLSSSDADGAASAVSITLDLELEDTVVLSSRTFAANFVKGVPVRTLLDHRNSSTNGSAIFYGAVNAWNSGAPSAVKQAGLATGAALANKMAGNQKVAVAFIEGGATALTECRVALELASTQKLPVLYVIEANLERRLGRILEEISKMFPVVTVDAHDAVAVYRVAQESIVRARDGGPSLVVCVPYDQNGAKQNAVANMEQYLAGKKLFRNQWKDQALAEFDREVGAACLPPANPLA